MCWPSRRLPKGELGGAQGGTGGLGDFQGKGSPREGHPLLGAPLHLRALRALPRSHPLRGPPLQRDCRCPGTTNNLTERGRARGQSPLAKTPRAETAARPGKAPPHTPPLGTPRNTPETRHNAGHPRAPTHRKARGWPQWSVRRAGGPRGLRAPPPTSRGQAPQAGARDKRAWSVRGVPPSQRGPVP